MLNENLIQSLTTYTTALEQQLAALEARVVSLQSTVDSLQSSVERLATENEELKEQIANLPTIPAQAEPAEEPEIEVEIIMEDEEEVIDNLDGLDTLDILEENEENTESESVVEPVVDPIVEAEPVVIPVEPTPLPVVEVVPEVELTPEVEKPAPRPIPQQTSLFGSTVEDIRQAISLGDRFLFQRELFAGNGELMQKTLDELNSLGSLSEAMEYVVANFAWDKDSTAVQLFENVLKRRFGN